MFYIAIAVTYIGLFVLLGSGYGFGVAPRHETRRITEPRLRPTGEERMG